MKRLLCTTTILFSMAVPSLAGTFHADTFSQPGINRNVTVTLGSLTENVSAGEINLHRNVPAADLVVWCLDLIDLLYTPYDWQIHNYTAGDVRPGMPTLNASQVRQIASLMVNGLSLGGAEANAATQLGIWKIEYGGALTFSGLSVALATALNSELTNSAVGGLFDCPGCTMTVLSDAIQQPNQALGYAVNGVPAPVAGTGLPGVLAGIVGLWGLAKRRRDRRSGLDVAT